MSLLDDGRDVLRLYRDVPATDVDGNPVKVPSAPPVTVWGRLQPVSATEVVELNGDLTVTMYRFICRCFPAGAWALIETPGGRTWDVAGEPLRARGSESIRHDTVLLRAREPEVT